MVPSIPDLWAKTGHDWRRPVVFPTLPVAPRQGRRSVRPVVPDKERRDRLAFAIRAAMGKRTAEDIAGVIDPKRSKETIARWARGETVPSLLDAAPLAEALGVRVELLVSPPPLPDYPIAEYLIDETVRLAGAAERRGSARGEGTNPEADDGPRSVPTRRSGTSRPG